MTSFAFDAGCVRLAQPEDAFLLVGFADQAFDTNTFFMLQRSLEFDAQDVASGMDSYHVEWCDQSRSGYGGIMRFQLLRDGAEATFSPAMAATLGGLERLTIRFRLTDSEQASLRFALQRIFEGTDVFLDDADLANSTRPGTGDGSR